jgi:hypothetical protein
VDFSGDLRRNCVGTVVLAPAKAFTGLALEAPCVRFVDRGGLCDLLSGSSVSGEGVPVNLVEMLDNAIISSNFG